MMARIRYLRNFKKFEGKPKIVKVLIVINVLHFSIQENIANENPEVVNDLMERLSKYFKSMIPIDVTAEVKEGNPNNFGGFWGPGWCQSEPKLQENVEMEFKF